MELGGSEDGKDMGGDGGWKEYDQIILCENSSLNKNLKNKMNDFKGEKSCFCSLF